MRFFLCKGCDLEAECFICKLSVADAEVAPKTCPFESPQVDWAEVDEAEFDTEEQD